jgi:hypothetical protein
VGAKPLSTNSNLSKGASVHVNVLNLWDEFVMTHALVHGPFFSTFCWVRDLSRRIQTFLYLAMHSGPKHAKAVQQFK